MPGRRTVAAIVIALALAACAGAAGDDQGLDRAVVADKGSSSSTSRPTTTPLPSSTTTSTAPTTTTTAAPVRDVVEQGYTPFATVGGVTLHHPSRRVERIGFHESANDAARQLEALPTAAHPIDLETRDRDTPPHGAADVVVDPTLEIRAPVTGTVKRASGYVLYCQHHDNFVVIEPDGHPGWEVKVLHIDGEQVSVGQRVVAGETVLSRAPRQLPFESQVDEVATVKPAWPHVHVEVVDPSLPDRPTPGGCS